MPFFKCLILIGFTLSCAIVKMVEKHHHDRVRPLLVRLKIPAILLILVSLAYWKLSLTNQFTWLDSPDLANQVLPWYQYQVGEIQQGRIPLWDPNHWGGQPLIGQALPGTASPIAWMMMILPTRHGWIKQATLHWYFIAIHWIAALFFYWFARSLALHPAASVLGAVLFTLGGYIGSVDWPQMMTGALWVPIVFGAMFRALRNERFWGSCALSGAAMGLGVLSGHHQAPLFMAVGALAIWLAEIALTEGRQRRTFALGLVVQFLLAGFVSGLQSVPAWEYSKLALRWVGMPEPVSHSTPVDYLVHGTYGLPAFSLLGIVIPGIYRHLNPFVGVIGTVLAVAGARWNWANHDARRLVALGVGTVLFAFAGDSSIHGMLYGLLPILEKARNPAMSMLLFHLAACGLAAMALDRLLRGEFAAEIARFFGRAVGALAVLVSFIWYGLIAYRNGEVQGDTRVFACLFIGLAAAGLMAAWAREGVSKRALVGGLGLLLLAEMGTGASHTISHRRDTTRTHYLPALAANADLAQFLQAQPGNYRYDQDMAKVSYNFSDWYGVETTGAYLASVTANMYSLPIWSPQGQRLLGVRYAWMEKPNETFAQEIFKPKSGGAVYENRNALPRVRTVHRLRERSGETVEDQLNNTDLAAEAFLKAPLPEVQQCSGEDYTSLLRRVSTRVVIWAEMRCRGMLVLSDTWYPGWEATVDGKPAKIHEVYGSIRGVVVDAGMHRVEMRYRPWSVYVGFAMTLAGLIGAALVIRSNR